MAENTKKKQRPEINTLVYGKVPPQAVEMERAVLSCIINDGAFAIEQIRNMVPSSDVFYKHEHQLIWNAIHKLHSADKPIDLLTVTDQLKKDGSLEIVGGAYFITQLAMEQASSHRIETYHLSVLEQYFRREIIRIGGISINDAYDPTLDIFETHKTVFDMMSKVMELKLRKPIVSTHEHGINVIKTLLEKKDKNLHMDGMITGFPCLDVQIGGWRTGEIVVIAGRPGTGKTTFAINTAMAMSHNQENNPYAGPGIFFSLEMKASEIATRMITCISGVKKNILKSPSSITPDVIEKLQNSVNIIKQFGINIVDDMDEVGQIVSTIRTEKAKRGIRWVVIDYLQLMKGNFESRENRDLQIAKITRELKKIAIELDIMIIELCQMNRDSAKINREPELTDLRDSGAIEQDADKVAFLYHPTEKMVNDKPKARGMIMLSIKKDRNGEPNAYLILHFNKHIQRFVDADWLQYDTNGKPSYREIPIWCMKDEAGGALLPDTPVAVQANPFIQNDPHVDFTTDEPF